MLYDHQQYKVGVGQTVCGVNFCRASLVAEIECLNAIADKRKNVNNFKTVRDEGKYRSENVNTTLKGK
jgi:hypothetical protein